MKSSQAHRDAVAAFTGGYGGRLQFLSGHFLNPCNGACSSESIGDCSLVMGVSTAGIRFDRPGLAPLDPPAPGVEIHWTAERM